MPSLSLAQLDENCTVSILNRSVQVQPDGTWGIPNVPVEPGYFRVRVSCTTNGVTYGGQSEYFLLIPGSPSTVRNITLGPLAPLPVALTIASPKSTLTTRGETVQMTAEAAFADGTTGDVTELADGTFWSSSNPQIADVSSNGLVTARSRGLAIIQARNEGVLASFSLSILIPNDADGDGMTDEFERANGLNPNDSTDAAQDPDTDGLTSLQEFQRGTNPRAADTDTDGVADGAEVLAGTNPLRGDSDSDGLSDGAELVRGTNPLNTDSDGDGIPDGLELQLGLDPAVANATTRVEGRVVDPLGAPIQGASVTVFSVLVASSDATGFFAIDGVPATEGPLTALAQIVRAGQIYDGMSSATAPVSGGVTAMGTIQLQLNAGTVSGLVTGPLGDPVPGALVTIAAGADTRTTTADGGGRYRVSNMTAGSLLVTVRDPRSGLRGRATGALLLNQSAVVNVELGPRATITGTVFERDGVTPVLPGATVRLSGIANLVTQTDPLGRYLFDFVPLGSYTVEASDAANNRGRTSGELTATAQVNVSDVTYLGRGTVTGVVRDGGGNPVANASVSLSSASVFGGRGDVTSDAQGRFSFVNVFIGPFQLTARAPIARLGGNTTGVIESEGQTVNADVTLVAAGTLAGTVFRPDGATPVRDAVVTVSPGGLSAVTDAQGRYRFEFMPVGFYTVDAFDPGTGDRGRAGGSISSQDETRTVNVTLIGQGTVVVTVRDGGGQLVPGARVTFSSFSIFGGSRSGNTAADGTITFGAVPAADFSISASDPATGLGGMTSGTVAVDGTAAVTVNLQGAGSIAGRVFAADGTTPVPGMLVRASGPRGRDTRTDAEGAFRFDIMPTGTYTVDALDGRGNLRGRVGGVAVTAHGQVVSANLTLIGVGTVGGIVRNPDSTPAAGIAVSLDTDAPGFGSLFSTQTDVEGRYSIGDVPLGTFTVTASGRQGDLQLFGVAASQVANHGDNVTVDVTLSGTLIPINTATATLYDANNFIFDLLRGGEIQDGMRQIYGGDFNANRGAAILEVVVNGTSRRFGGSGFGTIEEGGRELVLSQTGVNGLDVTRKIYVPCDGYFARYLEILSNNTANVIVAGVRVSSHFRFINKVQGGFNFSREPRVISTSSGDTTVGVGDGGSRDHWAIIDDDDDGDPFLLNTLPAVADVFDGPGGTVQATSVGYTIDFTQRFGRLVTEWTTLTVPPGGAVAILHFAAQQTSRGSARASAERLAQLPPEALAGLNSAELALIQNFDVPLDGTSALPALPPLTGTVTGRTLAGDGSNAMAGVLVRLRSNNPFYGRTHIFNANGVGVFSRVGRVTCNGASTPLPADDFTLVAVNPWSGRDSAPVMGGFQPGLLTVEQDIVFEDTGNLAGTVRRHSGVVASSGSVRISGGLLLNSVSAAVAADGSYRVIGLPEGLYTLVATVPVAQGSDLIGSASANLVAGETFLADITIEETGTLTGIVRRNGVAVINLLVQLRGPGNLSRSTRTDTGGRYTFNDVPSGPVTIEAFDSASNTAASEDVTVLTDQTVTRDLALTVGGTVEGLVTAPNNQPVEGAQVALTATSGTFNTATDAAGRYRFVRVTPGNVSVAVFDPVSLRRGQASGSLGLSGQTLTLNVRLLDAGSVTGLVLRADGVTPVVGAAVSISGSTFASTRSDAGGGYRFDFVPIGSFTLDVTDAATGDRGRAVNQVNAVGETRTVNVVMNGQGRVNVTVRDASGNTVENARVSVTSQTIFGGTQQSETGSDGQVTFERVLAGGFLVTANHPLTTLSGSTNGSVAVGGEANVTVRLQAAGTVLGLVLAPDGATPVGGANVRLLNSFFGFVQQVSSAADGSFRFDAVPLGTYQIEARDDANRLRARETNVRLQANGETASRNLVFVGLGTVAGRV
ncbi:MAG TPA: carboxypeptidase regulatory-like domain-containing protein, partial [Methylomirabilota bacterium]|nr:carboxypeptidase regulatory-like domain-containing protein [Methylomirabilota bacterium]